MNQRLRIGSAALAAFSLLFALPAFASPLITLPEFEGLFPDYVNHEEQNGFQGPCVDPAGTMTIQVNVNDILGTMTEPIAVAMVCQSQASGPFTAAGPITFSDPGVQLLSFATVPGHDDAFSIEFIVPQGSGSFQITIENTGWPEGCITDLLDLAAWDLVSVGSSPASFGVVKSGF